LSRLRIVASGQATVTQGGGAGCGFAYLTEASAPDQLTRCCESTPLSDEPDWMQNDEPSLAV
jgi:hypothetical protein